MYFKVNYDRSTYFLDEANKEVFTSDLKIIKREQLKRLKFENINSFFNFLELIHKKNVKNPTLTELTFRNIIMENLMLNDKSLSYDGTKELIKGLNYSICKQNDIVEVLDLLDKIKQKHPGLTYSNLSYDPKVKINTRNIMGPIKKFLQEPYFRTVGSTINCVPLIFEKALQLLKL